MFAMVLALEDAKVKPGPGKELNVTPTFILRYQTVTVGFPSWLQRQLSAGDCRIGHAVPARRPSWGGKGREVTCLVFLSRAAQRMPQSGFQLRIRILLLIELVNAQSFAHHLILGEITATLHLFDNESSLVLCERNSHALRLRHASHLVKSCGEFATIVMGLEILRRQRLLPESRHQHRRTDDDLTRGCALAFTSPSTAPVQPQ
jgi:hypothetical protein